MSKFHIEKNDLDLVRQVIKEYLKRKPLDQINADDVDNMVQIYFAVYRATKDNQVLYQDGDVTITADDVVNAIVQARKRLGKDKAQLLEGLPYD